MGEQKAAHFIRKSKKEPSSKRENPAIGILRTELHHNQGSLVEYAVAKPVCANSLH